MPVVVGIRFKDSGKTYFFDPNNYDTLETGEHVIVETIRGPEIAKVVHTAREVSDDEIIGELKPVMRRVETSDFERLQTLNENQEDLIERCSEKIRDHDLPMRLVKAEYSFDGSRLTFYFTAEKRVDFRMLVRDLARTFRTRIELRQIGPRDEAKLLGGIGPCGRLLCCATFLPDYARVSIKMAKDQDLPLNPSKISGVCGRLLCCLSYEHDQYLQIKEELPSKGTWVQTPDGPGEVVAVNVVKETITVALGDNGVREEYTPEQVQESIDRVGSEARRRNVAGITPFANRERKEVYTSQDDEGTHANERHSRRDEIDNPNILDALALLEEDVSEWTSPTVSDTQPQIKASSHEQTPHEHTNTGTTGAQNTQRSSSRHRNRRNKSPQAQSTTTQPSTPSTPQNETSSQTFEAEQSQSRSSRRRRRRRDT
ncbi:MAG: hypothetical protein GFH27_549307n152 [Chloroflexi bacterium AL-W]|nr:hypothetical protein [Chloroflexi bacterium AL-N1]NOK69184.1 hypothetical protein [Chloroflexi bacterium AL-N10]NOK77167.1 hypothetical protein [Chloroflexi bacterium AL-N5]NOK83812.1 hypothetical protein [Chloroflexi bacterium AL-W]NOK91022.1 hypothetical protein [Chloroflexi bacterium AL-N15]